MATKTKKPVTKKQGTKANPPKPSKANVANKKIVVKPPTVAKPFVKSEKKGLGKPMTKVVVDRVKLPSGGKIFVKPINRPAKTATKKPTNKKNGSNKAKK